MMNDPSSTTSSEAGQTFHKFRSFPHELQLLIWDTAARDFTVPGVQFFSVRPFQNVRRQKWQTHAPIRRLGLPLGSKPWRDSCPEARSTYHLHDGLWTACHASRMAMHRAFRRKRICDQSSHESQVGPLLETMTHSSTAVYSMGFRDGTKLRQIKILPHDDLIFISSSFDHHELFSLAFSWRDRQFTGFRHVAIPWMKFDATLNGLMLRRMPKLELQDPEMRPSTIWFVDDSPSAELADWSILHDSGVKFRGDGFTLVAIDGPKTYDLLTDDLLDEFSEEEPPCQVHLGQQGIITCTNDLNAASARLRGRLGVRFDILVRVPDKKRVSSEVRARGERARARKKEQMLAMLGLLGQMVKMGGHCDASIISRRVTS